MSRACRNCREEWEVRYGLCPFCRRIGRDGVFLGGVMVGLVWAIVERWPW